MRLSVTTRHSLSARFPRAFGLLRVSAAACLLLGLASDVASAQGKGGMEEFEEVDPYTKGDKDKVAALGYVRMGSFLWQGSERTEHVAETMGGLDVLWVETEHFRIGSSLGTYKIPNDRFEKTKLKEEFKALKKKLKKFKAPKKKLDPWVRLHLFAMRAEQLYADHVEEFGLESLAENAETPHLGHPNKFLLLLCQRRSEFGRYLRKYATGANDYAYATGNVDDGMFFGLNVEIIVQNHNKDPELPYDTMLHCHVAAGLTGSFINGHKQQLYTCPRWFSIGASHRAERRVDPRWVSAGTTAHEIGSEHWKWEGRVESLVKNDFFAKMSDMLGWEATREMNERDHMVAWSKVDYLLGDLKGNRGEFLDSIVTPVPDMAPGEKDELERRQTEALEAAFGLTPDAFDKRWKKWVKSR